MSGFLSVQTNMMVCNANNQFNINNKKLFKNAEKLSSGYKINRAADDAAGLSISEKMRWMIRGLNQGTENTTEGISWCQIGDGAMGEVDDMTQRINELAVKGADGTLTDADRQMIDAEIQQLKKQINTIGKNTTFNEIPIFDNSYVCLDVQGSVDSFQFFDATYDDLTGEVSFGGVIFNGERITWDKINPDMVSIDPDTGKQVLKEGMYSYKDAKGNSFSFTVSGPDPSDISFKKEISADANGLYIDGEFFEWRNVLDEDGESASPSNYHSGSWGVDYHGAVFSFYMPEGVGSFDDFINAIVEANNVKAHYVWEIKQVGQKPEQAVDITTVDRIRISEEFANDIDQNDYSITIRADKDKIWLEDSNKNVLDGSERTWAEMGIDSWDSGSDISATKTYVYYTDDMQVDPYFSFDFTLSNVTSVDSVIDGLDGVVLSKKNIVTNYEMDIDIDENTDPNIISVGTRANKMMTFERERAFGRDFDNKEVDDVAIGRANTSEIVFSDGTSVDILSYKVVQETLKNAQNKFESDLIKYWDYIAKIKQSYLLSGGNPEDAFKSYKDLRNIVGKENVTSAGYLNDLLTIDSNSLDSMTKGDPGVDGGTYPSAYIDFKNITDASVLNGSGFDSTCKTCNNHYSITFEGDITGYGNIQTTKSGYRYSWEQNNNDYYLRIDTGYLAGLDGEGIAAAIVEIASEAKFDSHFTQYASEGSKLYIYDNRESSDAAPSASFYTKPYSDVSQDTFTIQTKSEEGDYLDLTYTYDFADFANRVTMSMKVDNDNGEYIKVKNEDGSEYYKLASAPLTGSETRADTNKYTLAFQYKDSDGKIVDIADPEEAKQAAIKDYAEDALESMLGATTVTYDAKDYTYMNVGGNEKPNVAIRAEFESRLREIETNNGISIKHSGISGDLTTIPRFALNTVVMGMYAAGSKTIEQAEQTINYAKEALSYIAEKRSLYGALQNRLEHTYNNNMNKSENTTAAESRIRDTDIATEIVEHSKNNIIRQAATSMLSQANQNSNYVLQILR